MIKRIKLFGILTTVLSLTSCSSGITVADLPLPNNSGIEGGYRIIGEFTNALNLPEQAKVKLGGITVGEVEVINVKDYVASVTMKINNTIRLKEGTTASLRQATPLGDVFIALSETSSTATEKYLTDNAVLSREQTSAAATVEDLLVAASLIVHGGGLREFGTIISELDAAVGGRGGKISTIIKEFTSTISSLNEQTDKIDAVLDQAAILAVTLDQGKNVVAEASITLGAGVEVVNNSIAGLVGVLAKASLAGEAATTFVNKSGGDLKDLIIALGRVLSDIAETEEDLEPTLDSVHALIPGFAATSEGSAIAGTLRAYSFSTGIGVDPTSHLPDDKDMQAALAAIRQTLERVQARLTGTQGCCQ
ncbi:MAG: MlaD family protein [Mycobacteriaceae bacterium]